MVVGPFALVVFVVARSTLQEAPGEDLLSFLAYDDR